VTRGCYRGDRGREETLKQEGCSLLRLHRLLRGSDKRRAARIARTLVVTPARLRGGPAFAPQYRDSFGNRREVVSIGRVVAVHRLAVVESSPHVAHASLVDSTATAIPNDPISTARRRNFGRTIIVVRDGA
jgi:hypothetical protein